MTEAPPGQTPMSQEALSPGLEYDRMFRDLRSRQRKAALTAAIGGMTGTISPEQAMAKYGLRRATPPTPPTEARLAMQQQLIDQAKNLADLRRAGDESSLEAIKQSVELKKQMLQSAAQLSGTTVTATGAVASARNAALASLHRDEKDITEAAMKYITDSGVDTELIGFSPTDPNAAEKVKAILGKMTEQLMRANREGQSVAFTADTEQFLLAVNRLQPQERARILAGANLFIMSAKDQREGAPESLPELLRSLADKELLTGEEARFAEQALTAEDDMTALVDKVVMESEAGSTAIKKQLTGGINNEKATSLLEAAIDAIRGKFGGDEDPTALLAQLTDDANADADGIDEVLPKILEGLDKLSEENLDPSLQEVREAMKESDWFRGYMTERGYEDPDMAFKAYYREVKDEVKARRAKTRQNERAFRSGAPPVTEAPATTPADAPAPADAAAATSATGAPQFKEGFSRTPKGLINALPKPPTIKATLREDLDK